MKRPLNEIETFRAQELLLQRATEGLDDRETAELVALGAEDDLSFELAASAVDLATIRVDELPIDVADKILIAAGVDAARTTVMPAMVPMTLAGVVMPRPISTTTPPVAHVEPAPLPAVPTASAARATPASASTPTPVISAAPAPVIAPTPPVVAAAPTPVIAPTPPVVAAAPTPVIAPTPPVVAAAPTPVIAPTPPMVAAAPTPVIAPTPPVVRAEPAPAIEPHAAASSHLPVVTFTPPHGIPRVIPIEAKRKSRAVTYAVIAAAASIALAAGAVVWATQRPPTEKIVEVAPPPPKTPTMAEARAELLATAKDVTTLPWTATQDPNAAGASGEVVWSASAQRGYMRFKGLAPNDSKAIQYQLWIFDKDRDQAFPVDGGVFDVSSTGEVIIPITAKLRVDQPVLFAVTVEKPGGVVVSKRERIVVTAAPKTG
ncbi:MAG: hypothetical protein IPQ07_24085 [Myxococcales bacterium]|nr:hypothetical protein [Myxococcales bacterium]